MRHAPSLEMAKASAIDSRIRPRGEPSFHFMTFKDRVTAIHPALSNR